MTPFLGGGGIYHGPGKIFITFDRLRAKNFGLPNRKSRDSRYLKTPFLASGGRSTKIFLIKLFGAPLLNHCTPKFRTPRKIFYYLGVSNVIFELFRHSHMAWKKPIRCGPQGSKVMTLAS